jgi:hypothetical protein
VRALGHRQQGQASIVRRGRSSGKGCMFTQCYAKYPDSNGVFIENARSSDVTPRNTRYSVCGPKHKCQGDQALAFCALAVAGSGRVEGDVHRSGHTAMLVRSRIFLAGLLHALLCRGASDVYRDYTSPNRGQMTHMIESGRSERCGAALWPDDAAWTKR